MKNSFLALFLISANILTAQVVTKVPPTQVDSLPPVVMTPIGEVQDTVYLRGVLAQEKEPLKVERFIGITRTYVFENPKFNKPIEQWFERIPSALTPNPSNKRITDFQKDMIWYQVLPKPK